MNSPFRELAELDHTVHAPPRLAILTVLLGCQEADFTFLLTATGLTKGNLASNLTTLEAAGLIESRKGAVGRRPCTNYWLTGNGRTSVETHWESLERLKHEAIGIPLPAT